MTDLAKLVVKLEAQTAQYHAELKKANDRLIGYQKQTNARLAAMNRQWSAFGSGIKNVFAGLTIGIAIRKIVKETSEAQKAMSQLEAVVKSTGGAAGFTVPELSKMAEEIQRTTTFSDDQAKSMQALLLQFTRISGPEFKAAQQAIVDMATRLETDLGSAALMVGKALNDPIRGLTALSKRGVQFSKDQESAIKALVKTGRLAEAQGIILKELEVRFGGAADAARGTFGGAVAGVTNALNDLFEVSDSGSSKATESLNRLAEVLQDPAVKMAADTLLSGLIRSLAWILENAGKVAAGIGVIFGAAGDRVEEINAEIEDLQGFKAFGGGVVFGDAFGEKGLASIISPAEIDAQIKALIREQEALLGVGQGGMEAAKGLKQAGAAMAALGGGGEAPGDPEAIANIEKMIAGLRMQVDTFGMSAAAIARYRIEQGDLADDFDAAGGRAAALGGELVTLSGRLERLQESSKRAQEVRQAGEAIATMVEDLREQVAVFGLGEVAVMRYRLEHGALAAQFELAGPAVAAYKEEMLRLTEVLEQQKAAQKEAEEAQATLDARTAEGAAVYEATRTATERYAAEIIRLKDLMREGLVDAETFQRAVGLATKEWEEASKQANAFSEQASRNVQDIIATTFEDLVLKGEFSFDRLFQSFNEMIVKMAAQAAAAKLAESLFGSGGVGSGGGLLDTAFGFLGSLFGGGRSAAFGAPHVSAMQPVRVGERGRAEWFLPGMDGQIVPEERMLDSRPRVTAVTQNISFQGRADNRTMAQLAMETTRRQRMANARLG